MDYLEADNNLTTASEADLDYGNYSGYDYDDYILDDDGNVICNGPTPEETEFYLKFAWWLEGVGQMTVGGIGFLANCIAIPILCSREMSSMFNRLLTCLAVFDNIFIVCSLLDGVRKHIRTSQIHEYLFGYFLYQFHNMVMCCSAYTTVVLALERYRAVWRPIEYHNNVNSLAHPWRRVLWTYVAPVVAFSILFNLPKFFEVKFVETTHYEDAYDPIADETIEIPYTVDTLTPTDLRLNDYYVLWYSNVGRLIVTGVVPFTALAYLNSRIFSVVRRRRRMTNRPSVTSAASAAQKAEETRQAIVLFVIVIMFVCCHALRILLNVNELLTLEVVRASIHNNCASFPFWAMISASVSQFLITVNSSVNFFIYCFMSRQFRKVLIGILKKIFCGCDILDHLVTTPVNNGNREFAADGGSQTAAIGLTEVGGGRRTSCNGEVVRNGGTTTSSSSSAASKNKLSVTINGGPSTNISSLPEDESDEVVQLVTTASTDGDAGV